MGGGVMRTAAKVGIASGAAAAAGGRFRHAAPAFATAASAESAAAAAPLVSAGGEVPAVAAAGAQWPSWELDDWEFADWKGGAAAGPEETAAAKPRLVFAPPSREEAEEATTDLREAIERVYFSEAPVEVVKEKDKELSNWRADAIIPAMPGHVVQTFTLLKSSPEAQGVVASLVSDKNVWEAVFRNEKVMEFCKTHQPTLIHAFPEDTATVESPEKLEGASSENSTPGELPTPTGSPFSDFVDNAKKTVMDIVDNITQLFQDMFQNDAEAEAEAQGGASSSTGKGSSPSVAEMAAGGSLMALVVAVILVVIFKRA
ncbi:hypothetical protein ABZP36_025199 [Zizania latifolia]